MLEWVAIAAAALGGRYAYTLVRRRSAHRRWREVLASVSQSISGRASAPSMFSAPELRGEVDGITVTLKLEALHLPSEHGRAEASSRLPAAAENARFYVGWDVLLPPPELSHIAEVPYPGTARIEGELSMRADDPALAQSFLKEGIVDLEDLRREAGAHGLEVIVRGGYLTIRVHGIRETPYLLERAVRVSASLARLLERLATGAGGSPALPERTAAQPCMLCGGNAIRSHEPWVACARCGAPFHEPCWRQANGCLAADCVETRSRPFAI